jgi:putative DNA primase/helicase
MSKNNTLKAFCVQAQTAEIVADFADFARCNGANIDATKIAIGKLARCPSIDRVQFDCGYVLHLDGYPNGIVWNFRTGGEAARWRPAQSAFLRGVDRVAIADARQRRIEEQGRRTHAAAGRACRQWSTALVADPAHPYLRRKRVAGLGVRQCGADLLVPVHSDIGGLMTLQRITRDGRKRFLLGGQKNGGFHRIAGRSADVVLLCEGYATGASMHMATGHAVAVAFDCGNLAAVANALRARYPAARLVLCADDDNATPGNPGVTKAIAAARAVGGIVAVPTGMPGPADFNDLHVAFGLDAVAACIAGVLS